MRLVLWVAGRCVLRRRNTTVTIALIATVLTTAVLMMSAVTNHVRSALDDSVRLSQGQARVAVTTDEPSLARLLSARGYEPVRESIESVAKRSGSASAQVPLRQVTSDVTVPGRLVEGRLPGKTGEAVITPHLSRRAGLTVGSTLTATLDGRPPENFTVSGVVVDPIAPSGDRAAVRVEALPVTTSNLWLGKEDPNDDPELASAAERLQVQPISSTFGDNNASPVGNALSNLGAATWLVALLGFVVVLVLLMALRHRARRDVDALTAAGFTTRHAQAALHLAWGAALLMGVLGGVLLTWLLQLTTNAPLGALFNQVWSGTPVPGTGLQKVLCIAVAAPLILSYGTSSASPKPPSRTRGTQRGRTAVRAFALMCSAVGSAGVLAIALPLALRHTPPVPATSAPLFGVLALIGLPAALRRIANGGAGAVTRQAVDTLTRPVQKAALAAALLVFVGTTWAVMAGRVAADNDNYTTASTPLQVVNVPADDAKGLMSVFEAHGGTPGDTYVMLAQSDQSSPIAVSAAVEKCMQQAHRPSERTDCLSEDSSATTMVLTDSTATPTERNSIRGTSALGDGEKIGVVWVSADGSVSRHLATTGLIPQSDEANAASVVIVGSDSPAARAASLQPGGYRFLTLPGYFTLPTQDQASVRSFLYTSMPTAAPQSSIPPGDDALRALAVFIGVGVSLLGVLLLALVSSGQTQTTKPTLDVMHELSTPRTSRPLRRAAWTPALLVGTATSALAAICSWAALPHNGAGVGPLWLVPLVSFTAISLGQWLSMRSPATSPTA